MRSADKSPKTAVLVGPDERELGDALAGVGVDVTRVEGVPTSDGLQHAGIDDTGLFVVTDVEEASTIAVARERNPDVVVVVYDDESLPSFARGQADIAVDPAALGPEAVAEELLGREDAGG